MSYNNLVLVGNVGHAPELKATKAGLAVVELSVATSDFFGEKVTQWHRVVLFGQRAEYASKYVSKGDTVAVSGPIRFEKYVDKDGSEKVSTKVCGNSISVVSSKKAEAAPVAATPSRDEEMPF